MGIGFHKPILKGHPQKQTQIDLVCAILQKTPSKYFAEFRGLRMERDREHLLEEILLITFAAVLSAAESWNDIAAVRVLPTLSLYLSGHLWKLFIGTSFLI